MQTTIDKIALLETVTLNGVAVRRSSLFGFTIDGRTHDAATAAAIVEAAAPRKLSLGSQVAILTAGFRARGRVAVSADLKARGGETIIVEVIPAGARTEDEIHDFANEVRRALTAAGLVSEQRIAGRILAWRERAA